LLDPKFFRDGTKEPDAANSHMDELCFALAASFDEKPPQRLSHFYSNDPAPHEE
jgi:hypothetical protein